jgi:hypothetical protein
LWICTCVFYLFHVRNHETVVLCSFHDPPAFTLPCSSAHCNPRYTVTQSTVSHSMGLKGRKAAPIMDPKSVEGLGFGDVLPLSHGIIWMQNWDKNVDIRLAHGFGHVWTWLTQAYLQFAKTWFSNHWILVYHLFLDKPPWFYTALSLSRCVCIYIYIFLCRHHHIYIQIPDAMRCDHAKLIPNFGRQSSLRQMGRTILLLRFSLLPINGTEVGAISSWVNCQRPRCKFKQWSRYWKHTMTWDDFPDKRPTMLKWTFRKREGAAGEMNRCEWLTDSMWLSHVWRLGDPILLMDWPQVLWAKSSISLKQFPHKQCTSGCMP